MRLHAPRHTGMAETVLAHNIQAWIISFGDQQSTRWFKRFRAYCEGSWTAFIPAFVLTLLGAIRFMETWLAVSFNEASKQMALINGLCACFCAEVFYIRKRETLASAFSQLYRVAKDVETEADNETKAYFSRVVVWCRRWAALTQSYSGVSMTGVIVSPLLTGRLEFEMWGVEPRSPAALSGVLAIQLLFLSPVCFSAFRCYGMFLNATMWSGALFRVLSGRVQAARGRSELEASAQLHSRLDSASAAVDAQLSDYMAVFLMPLLVASMLATYNVVSGRMDPYCFTPIPLLLVMFLPLCVMGQRLEDASGSDLSFAAYAGSWCGEDAATRRIRSLLMTRAAVPRRVSSRGVGLRALNLPACQSTMKAWFQFLQMLLNLRTASST